MRGSKLMVLIGVDVLVVVVAPVFACLCKSTSAFQAGAALVGVWTFLMVWAIQHGVDDHERNRTAVRDAIVFAFVTTYLAVIGWTAFWPPDGKQSELPSLTGMFGSHFTYLTGIVVAAHIGAGALEKLGSQRTGQDSSATGSP